tara:strand:- start:13040 stop:13501 length:462 start_codon:yes stop_codon:yes gene_type:complete
MFKIILTFVLSILLMSCGFKKINTDENKIFIQDISVIGEKRMSYMLKNNIFLISKKEAEKKYKLKIELTRERKGKIKSKTGKITRYNINVALNLTMENIDTQEIISKRFSRNDDYDVAKIHSDTIHNEANIAENIVKKLSDDIVNFILQSSQD